MDTTEITALLDERSEAIRARDLDRLLACYADDIVYFDLVPGLQYVGSAALRDRFAHWFAGWKAIRQVIDGLRVQGSGDLAVASMLIRAGGTRQDGAEAGFWVRATSACRRSDDGTWSITHEHISLPVDMATGRATLDLAPEP
jgi:uncharacterized protein (TIGR02246 family)